MFVKSIFCLTALFSVGQSIANELDCGNYLINESKISIFVDFARNCSPESFELIISELSQDQIAELRAHLINRIEKIQSRSSSIQGLIAAGCLITTGALAYCTYLNIYKPCLEQAQESKELYTQSDAVVEKLNKVESKNIRQTQACTVLMVQSMCERKMFAFVDQICKSFEKTALLQAAAIALSLCNFGHWAYNAKCDLKKEEQQYLSKYQEMLQAINHILVANQELL